MSDKTDELSVQLNEAFERLESDSNNGAEQPDAHQTNRKKQYEYVTKRFAVEIVKEEATVSHSSPFRSSGSVLSVRVRSLWFVLL